MTPHRVGTSGFQYPAWKGSFYPEDLPLSKMLAYYAERFAMTEINYTFRSFPTAKTIERWKTSVPPGFRFALKAPQRITHFAKLRDCRQILRDFYGVVFALEEKLGPILFQLPPTFKKNADLLATFLNDVPEGMLATFEFRDSSWFDDQIFEALKSRDAALCVAESEDLSTPRVATASWGYLRLRRTDYSDIDLKGWTSFVLGQNWRESYTAFKHEDAGLGPKFGAQFGEFLLPADC